MAARFANTASGLLPHRRLKKWTIFLGESRAARGQTESFDRPWEIPLEFGLPVSLPSHV